MPVATPNLYPEFNVIRLSHLCLNVKDLVEAKRFYVDTLGLQVSDKNEKNVYMSAMEERVHHCLILQKSSAPGTVDVLGFKTFDNTDLDRAESYLKSKGQPTEWVKHLRIDHFNCFSTKVDASVAVYSDFGFRATEYTEDEDSKRLWAAWLHRKGGVHDMPFTNGTGQRLHHLAFWCPTPLNIIDLLDLMATTGYVKNIECGPGRHAVSNAFFLYIRDFDGHRTEIYCSDYQTVDPDFEPIKWDLKDLSVKHFGVPQHQKAGLKRGLLLLA